MIAAARGALLVDIAMLPDALSVAPPTLVDRAIALPTGTNHLRENSASRSVRLRPPIEGGDWNEVLSRSSVKQSFGSQKEVPGVSEIDLLTKVAAAALTRASLRLGPNRRWDLEIGEILICNLLAGAEASRRWQSRIRKICATG